MSGYELTDEEYRKCGEAIDELARLGQLYDACDWSILDSVMAAAILRELGIPTSPSLEPGLDPRRDKVACMLGVHRRGVAGQ